ncbi:MAG: cysteine synthase [Theionarchaea archaeon DG-70-1]|nr:MAG: cysteine synthase [Theionarchaea archaeon DG-70-1]
MKKIYDNVLELIGWTPLIRLNRIGAAVKPEILAKIESNNPTCSIKDRIGLYMIEEAERQGLLNPESVIVEPTTGNTGIALSLVAAVKGYHMIVVMPEFVSPERTLICQAFGAEVIKTPKEEGIEGVIKKAREILANTPNAFMPDQFSNPANPKAHRETTGKEILEQTDGKLDVFVAAAGTGGTLSGVASILKEKIPTIKVVVVEPDASPVLSGGKPGSHRIEGIGEGFIPEVLDTALYDEVVTVSDEEAFSMSRRMAREEGILAGISSGANICASLKVAQEMDMGRIVTLIPDCSLRYMSTDLFEH